MLTENKEQANDAAVEAQVQQSDQPQSTGECPAVVDDKVPVATEKSVSESAVEPVASTEQDKPQEASETTVNGDKPAEAEAKEADAKVEESKEDENGTEANGNEVPASTEACEVVKKDASEAAVEESADKQVKANGKHSNEAGDKEPATEQSTEDTNGVCKRKVADVVETTEEEKSPKKAKVVDEADQKPVEETAA